MTTTRYFAAFPVLRWLMAYILGISFFIAAFYFSLPQSLFYKLVVSTAIVSFLFLVFSLNDKKEVRYFRWRYIRAISQYILLFSLGFLMTYHRTEIVKADHFAHMKTVGNKTYKAIVSEPPLIKEKIITTIVDIQSIQDSVQERKCKGKVLINFEKDEWSEHLKYGNIVFFKENPLPIEAPKNPEEFDYKTYQSFHNVYHRLFLKRGYWRKSNRSEGNLLLSSIFQLRDYLLQMLKEHIPTGNELAVATAILLGYRDYMTADVVQAYSSSGALHVLSVSGLHVGIIFLVLNLMLKWLEKTKKGRIIRAIIIVLVLAFYATITGLSPSVLRAFVMLSLIVVGKTLDREANTYNILAASCFILLLWNPYLITEVGFRLSYLAVLGIVFLHPKIFSQWAFQNWFLDKAWGIISISIAAQATTFPLSVLYFHQFPNLFIISNLIVIPLSNLVLFVGLFLFFTKPFSLLYSLVGKGLYYLLLLLNKVVFWFDSFPYAIIQGIVITHIEMALLYTALFLFCWLLVKRRKEVVFALVINLILLFSSIAYRKTIGSPQSEWIVYASKNQRGIAWLHHHIVHYDFDSTLLNNKSAFLFHVQHHWWAMDIQQQKNLQEDETLFKKMAFGKLYLFGNKRILLIENELERVNDSLSKKLSVDYVILSHNAKVYVENLNKLIDYKQLIFDSSNKKWKINYWKKDCERWQIPYYDCSEKAFEMPL